jgi:adenosylcobinamide-phosphate synthase
MQIEIDHLYSNGALLVMWGALLFHFVIPIPRNAHPVIIWHKFAEQLADKVNTSERYQQRYLSGTLAWLLMILPTVALLVALKPLIWQPQAFELALLLLAFDWRSQEKLTSALIDAMAKEDKPQCKTLLATFVNRQTESLSMLGIGKTGAETIIMGFGRNVIGVLFWYGVFGGIGALIYRLIVELSRAWSPSRTQFQPFGLYSIRMLALIEFIPMMLFSWFIMFGKNLTAVYAEVKVQSLSWPLPAPGWLLTAVANKLKLSLGGPAIYDNKKMVRAKIGGRIAPSAIHLSQIQQLMRSRTLYWIVAESALLILINQGV